MASLVCLYNTFDAVLSALLCLHSESSELFLHSKQALLSSVLECLHVCDWCAINILGLECALVVEFLQRRI